MPDQRLINAELLSPSPLQDDDLRRKIQHNASTQVAKLPDELLSDIFLWLAVFSPLRSWFKINLVCQRWRNVAVATFSLWTEPPTHHHDLTMLMLKRSKKADLCIHLDYMTPDATTTAIMGHIERIQSLFISNLSSLSLQPSFDVLRTSPHKASRLESIRISGIFDSSGIRFSASDIPLRQLPRLRDLELAWITFDWDIFPLCNLTSLSLDKAELSDGILAPRLVEYLSQMPHLESIELSSHTHSPTNLAVSGVGLTVTALKLPHLFSLKIQYMVSQQLEVILSPMILPRLRLLEIIVEYINYSSFMTTISSIFLDGDFDTCDVVFVSTNSFRLIPSEEDAIDTLSIGLEVQFLGGPSPGDVAMKIMTGLNEKIRSRITKLVIQDNVDYPLHSDELLHLFASYFPHLELLQGNSIGIFLPKLKEITVRSVIHDQETWEELVAWLTLRHKCGVPIQKLRFNSFYPPKRGVLASFDELGVEAFDPNRIVIHM